MTGNAQLSSKSQSFKTRSTIVFLYAGFCLTGFSLTAAAQQSTYTANSLMEAFKKGSRVSLKGTEIKFTDVVVESKKSRVLFKSSGNDKVICELTSPTNNDNVKPFVGSPLTVVGKVRGRGLLGNVTLDDCSLPLSDATAGSSKAISVESAANEALPEQFEEQTEIPIENPIENPLEAKYPDTITKRAGPVSTKSRSPKGAVRAPEHVASVIPAESLSAQEMEQPSMTMEQPSIIVKALNSVKAALPVGFDFRVALLVAFTLLVFVKLLSAFVKRLRTSPNRPTTQEMRRAAIEALLLGKKKKTWRDRMKFKRNPSNGARPRGSVTA